MIHVGQASACARLQPRDPDPSPSRRLASRRRLKPAPQCAGVWGSRSGCGGVQGRSALS